MIQLVRTPLPISIIGGELDIDDFQLSKGLNLPVIYFCIDKYRYGLDGDTDAFSYRIKKLEEFDECDQTYFSQNMYDVASKGGVISKLSEKEYKYYAPQNFKKYCKIYNRFNNQGSVFDKKYFRSLDNISDHISFYNSVLVNAGIALEKEDYKRLGACIKEYNKLIGLTDKFSFDLSLYKTYSCSKLHVNSFSDWCFVVAEPEVHDQIKENHANIEFPFNIDRSGRVIRFQE